MEHSEILVGLEIGTSKVCMVVGEVRADGTVRVLGIDQIRSAGVRGGEIVDYPQVRTCVERVKAKAEANFKVEIGRVLLAVSGGDLRGENHGGIYRLPTGSGSITPADVGEACDLARDLPIPGDHVRLLDVARSFSVDGKSVTFQPVGLKGRTVGVELHLVHGKISTLEERVRCVREARMEVDEAIFSPLAVAQMALTRNDKDSGALVLDTGAGTADFVLYLDGAVSASGYVAAGGDQVTGDIHRATGLPWYWAEQVKCAEGDASGEAIRSAGTIRVSGGHGSTDVVVSREVLNGVIRARLEEILADVVNRLPDGALEKLGSGVFLTGGASRTRGFGELAHRIFGASISMPVAADGRAQPEFLTNPCFSTAVGLIRFVQLARGQC